MYCVLSYSVFCLVPQMKFLIKYVIPKVEAYWENIAYVVLKYDIPAVSSIRQKHQNNVRGCCQQLFENWLTTANGIKPKTWSVLLTHLKEVDELTIVTEMIKERLEQVL